jgi:Ca2+-binding RTX toxin-like protein
MLDSVQARSSMFEPLEERRMLSAAVILQIGGTTGDDTIVVERVGNTITVTENGNVQVFQRGGISVIVIDGNEGDDLIDLRKADLRSRVEGDDGDDTILGSNRNDRLEGDAGNDVVKGNHGNDKLIGDDGRDTLKGGAGDDHLDGGNDRDRLFGDSGNDNIDSRDTFWEDDDFGGSGTDHATIDDLLGLNDDTKDIEHVDS